MHPALWADRATPLPALRANHVRAASGKLSDLRKTGPIPSCITSTDVLDIFDEANALVYHPCALYSVAVAGRHPLAYYEEQMIWQRDRERTFVLADSGGFSAINNNLDVDWNSPDSINSMRDKLLRWLQKVPDAAVHLDIPLVAIGKNPHFTTFDQCLQMTKDNIVYWEEHCTNPNQQWIMPVHGRNEGEAIDWWDGIKETEAPFDGIAIGGALGQDFAKTLEALVYINKCGDLKNCKLIHIFGHFTFRYFVALSVLQQVLNETIGPNIRITFDAATPFDDAERGIMCSPKAGDDDVQAGVRRMNADIGFMTGDPVSFPAASRVMQDVTIQDMCVKHDEKHSFDGLSYILLGLHNLEVFLEGFAEIHTSNSIGNSINSISVKLTGEPVVEHSAQKLQQIIRAVFTSGRPALEIHAERPFLSTYL